MKKPSIKSIPASEVPAAALAQISERQRSYIDEFVFYEAEDETIFAYYAGDLVAIWDGASWRA